MLGYVVYAFWGGGDGMREDGEGRVYRGARGGIYRGGGRGEGGNKINETEQKRCPFSASDD